MDTARSDQRQKGKAQKTRENILCRRHNGKERQTKEKMLWCCDDVVCISVCNEVRWRPLPNHSSPTVPGFGRHGMFTDIMSHLEMNCTCLESLRLRFLTNTKTSQSGQGRLSISWKRSGSTTPGTKKTKTHPESWNGSTLFRILQKHPLQGYKWLNGRETRIQANSRCDNIWPSSWSSVSKSFQIRAKRQWEQEQPKLEAARQRRDIYEIPLDDEDSDGINDVPSVALK